LAGLRRFVREGTPWWGLSASVDQGQRFDCGSNVTVAVLSYLAKMPSAR
jgi:hypothetical protein